MAQVKSTPPIHQPPPLQSNNFILFSYMHILIIIWLLSYILYSLITRREGYQQKDGDNKISAITTLATDLNVPGHLVGQNTLSYVGSDNFERICQITDANDVVQCNLKKDDLLGADNKIRDETIKEHADKERGIFKVYMDLHDNFFNKTEKYQDSYHLLTDNNNSCISDSGDFRCDGKGGNSQVFTITKGSLNNYTIQNEAEENIYVDEADGYKLKAGRPSPSTFKIISSEYGHRATIEPVDECVGWCPFDVDEMSGESSTPSA